VNIAIALLVLAQPLEGPPELGAETAERLFEHEGFTLTTPAGWTVSDEPGSYDVRLMFGDREGSLTVWLDESNPPLRGVQRRVRKAARERGWKLVERRWTRVHKQKTLVLLFDIPLGAGKKTRQLFYFTKTRGVLYTMQYGTTRVDFDYTAFREGAATFRLTQ